MRNRKISHAEHRNLLKEGFGAETENKLTGKAQRDGRTVRGSEAAKRLEHERFGAEVPVGLLRKISHAEHRSGLKSWFGAETENKPTGKAQRNGRTVRGSEGERSEPEA